MSLRDEIADRAREFDFELRGEYQFESLADALMPLVERAVREGVKLYKRSGMLACEDDCKSCGPAIDAIVADVLK